MFGAPVAPFATVTARATRTNGLLQATGTLQPVATLVAQHENSETFLCPNPRDGRPAGVERGHGPCR